MESYFSFGLPAMGICCCYIRSPLSGSKPTNKLKVFACNLIFHSVCLRWGFAAVTFVLLFPVRNRQISSKFLHVILFFILFACDGDLLPLHSFTSFRFETDK